MATPLTKKLLEGGFTPPAPRQASQMSTGPRLSTKQQGFVNNLGYQPKDLPTFRSEDKNKSTSVIDKIFDLLGRGESGGTNVASNIFRTGNELTQASKKGDYLGVFSKVLQQFNPIANVQNFAEGALGDTRMSGNALYSQVVDNPQYDKDIKAIQQDPGTRSIGGVLNRGLGAARADKFGGAVSALAGQKAPVVQINNPDFGSQVVSAADSLLSPRSVGGLGLAIGLDPFTYIGAGEIAKAIPGVEGTFNKVKTALADIPSVRNFGAKYLGVGIDEGYKGITKTLRTDVAAGDQVGQYLHTLTSVGLKSNELHDLEILAERIVKPEELNAVKQAINLSNETVKTIVKAGGKVNQAEVFKALNNIATNDTTAQAVAAPLRQVIDSLSRQLAGAGAISPELAKSGENSFTHLIYNLNQATGDNAAERLLSGPSNLKVGKEAGMLKTRISDAERVFEAVTNVDPLIDRIPPAKLGKVEKIFEAFQSTGDTVKANADLKKLLGENLVKDVANEVRIGKGLINDASLLGPMTTVYQNRLLQRTKALSEVATNFAQEFDTLDAAKAAGYAALPETKAYGALAGKFIPEYMAADIKGIVQPQRGWLEKATNYWKQIKLYSPLNTATNMRNQVSNMALNSMVSSDALPIYRVDYLFDAAKQFETKQGKGFDAFRRAGGGLDSYAAQELENTISGATGSKVEDFFNKATEGMRAPYLPGIGYGKKAFDYTENVNRLAQFMWQTEHNGKAPEEAMKIVDKALFDYGTLPPGLKGIRDKYIPFLSFKFFAAQLALDTVINRTSKFTNFAKATKAIENITANKANDAALPQYMKDNRTLNLRTPLLDANGNPRYLDMTYMLPFGDVVGGFDPQDIILGNPFLRTAFETGTNQNIFFNQPIVKPGSTPEQANLAYLQNAIDELGPKSPLMPGLRDIGFDQAPAGTAGFSKIKQALNGETDQYGRRQDLATVLPNIFGGVKLTNVDPGKQAALNANSKKYTVQDVNARIRAVYRDMSLTPEQRRQQVQDLSNYRQQLISR